MATHKLDNQQAYTEQASGGAEVSVSTELVRTSFSEFAEKVTRESAAIRARYAALLLEDEEDEARSHE